MSVMITQDVVNALDTIATALRGLNPLQRRRVLYAAAVFFGIVRIGGRSAGVPPRDIVLDYDAAGQVVRLLNAMKWGTGGPERYPLSAGEDPPTYTVLIRGDKWDELREVLRRVPFAPADPSKDGS